MTRIGRIQARPRTVAQSAPVGLLPMELGRMRDSYLYVPASYRHTEPAALILMLHGSGGHAHHGVELLKRLTDHAGIILAAPTSRSYMWCDALLGISSDVKRTNRSLEHVFAHYAVDPERVTVAGFSDGASYALALGLENADLFKNVIAFSPRFAFEDDPRASRNPPRIFISHGMRDELMPISNCAQRIVAPLERAGLDVEYVEFPAGHRIPSDIADQAFEWLTRASESSPEPRRAQSPEIRARQEG